MAQMDEAKIRSIDNYIVDRESRALKGKLTNEELEEDRKLQEAHAAISSIFAKVEAQLCTN